MLNMLNMQYLRFVLSRTLRVPRMRCPVRRSMAAVDMFGRGAAVTVVLFSSGNA